MVHFYAVWQRPISSTIFRFQTRANNVEDAMSKICIITLALVSSCVDNRSPEFKQLSSLPRERWVEFAEGLPLEYRFTLYGEVYDASTHPRDHIVAEAFSRSGEAAFDMAIQRMVSRATFYKYLPILYALARNDEFDMCKPEVLTRVRNIAVRYEARAHLVSMINFGSCAL
jgi:hypothetical protein